MKNILVACEYSGTVRDAFAKKGHYAMSCDLLDTDSPGEHYKGDVRDVLNDKKWDLVIAHPECKFIANSGNQKLRTDVTRWHDLWDGCEFFKLFMKCKAPRVCIENPIPHKYAVGWIGRKYDQIIHPWQFGHLEQKATCLWLKGLPKLTHTNNVKAKMMKLPKKERQKMFYLPPSPDRWKLRSLTYKGFAEAMAAQWSDL